jgi:hypothetical protein
MKDNTSKRGFASMSKSQVTEIAKLGNKAQPREAKAKGGMNSHKNM